MTNIIVDPIAAESVSLKAEIGRLSGDLATYHKARSVVEAKIATIQVSELTPIVSAIDGFERERREASTKLAILEFSALAPSIQEGKRLFDQETQSLRSTVLAVQRSSISTDVKLQVHGAGDPLLRQIASIKLPGDTAHMGGGEVDAFWRKTWAIFLPQVQAARHRISQILGAAPANGSSEPPLPILTGGSVDAALQARG